MRETFRCYRRCAKAELGLASVREVQCGSVTVIQRFDSGPRLNVHLPVLALDGLDSSGPADFGGLVSHHLTRDELGRAAALNRYDGAPQAAIATYGFSGADRIQSATYENGTQSSRSFTGAREELERRFETTATQTLQTGFRYGRTNAGVVTGVSRLHEAGAGDAYRYTQEQWVNQVVRDIPDPLEESQTLASQLPSALENLEFTYDDAGNWNERSVNGVAEAFTPDPEGLNQYASVGGETYDYDENGNLRNDGQRLFTYDAFGLLVRVESATTLDLVAEYEYDALGQMVIRRTATEEERLIYDGNRVVAALDDTDTAKQQVTYHDTVVDIPVLLRTADGGGGWSEYFYQRDGIGSVVALTDSSGSVIERYEYDAHGKPTITSESGSPRSESIVGNRLMFASLDFDVNTGLSYMRARFYDPNLGRFLSPDPAGLADGTHLYAYAGNDPVNFVDPMGLARQATQDNPGLNRFSWVHAAGFLPLLSELITGRTITGEDLAAAIHEFGVQLGTKLLDAMPQGKGFFDTVNRFVAATGVAYLQTLLDVAGGTLATLADPGMIVRGISHLGEGTARGLQEIERGNWAMGVSMITAEVAAVVGIAAGGVAGFRSLGGLRGAVAQEPAPPSEPYNRLTQYGRTPTKADRRAFGASSSEVIDHDPPLVKRYYEGDPSKGEPPGYTLSQAERLASGRDRARMQRQPRTDSNKQGADMAKYSRQKKKEYGF